MTARYAETRDIEEIDGLVARFHQVFLLLDSCRFNSQGQPTHGRVILSTPNREEVYEELRKRPNSLVLYAGAPSDEPDGAFLDSGHCWQSCGL